MVPLTLTILGASPAAPNPGGVCSGYLLREGTAAVLMDCGAGTAGRIAQHVAPNRLQGVAISHLHPDHYFDLVQLYYILKFGEPRPAELSARLPLFLPPGGQEFMRKLGKLISEKPAMLEDIYDVRDYVTDCEMDIGGLPFSFHRVQHLFMCESAMLEAAQDEANPARRGHMSAAEAGQAAKQAGAKRLLITHYRSSPKHDAHHLAAASATFGGPVELAREGQTYVVG